MSKKIFILDDEEDMTELTSALLGFHGFEVTSSNDSSEGLKDLMLIDYDAIVLDLMMPGLDGFSVVRQLRESARHAKTPIVVVSAKRISDQERKHIIDWNIRFLAKPLSPKDLVQIVTESLATTA